MIVYDGTNVSEILLKFLQIIKQKIIQNIILKKF